MVPKRSIINILGVPVDDISDKEAIAAILKLAKDPRGGHYIVTVNAEFVMLAQINPIFAKILQKADLALADGASIVASKLIFGGKIGQRITGVDLVEKLCLHSAERTITVGFLGGFGKVAERVAKRQKKLNPKLKIVLHQPGDPSIGYDSKLKRKISQIARIDILFVAYGMGQQEFWIKRNLKKLKVGVFIGVGGAFDYLAGMKNRAPLFVQKIGLEWLWRLFQEPQRIWRMRVLPIFTLLVLKKWLTKIF